MKKQTISFAAGLLTGAVLVSGGAACAAGITARFNPQIVDLDGTNVQMEAYAIDGHNYVKLRDIGQAVGFNVYWADQTVHIDSDAPYTGKAPKKPETVPPESGADYSTQANPAIFDGELTHEVYNAVRGTIINQNAILSGTQKPVNMGTNIVRYGDLDNVLASIGRYPIYELLSQPGGYVCNVRYPDSYKAAADHTQSFINGLSGMGQREKVKEITWYVADRLTYDLAYPSPGEVLSKDTPTPGACMAYAYSFQFLCNRAEIPCILVSSTTHQWNMVYADGQWWCVDVSANDAGDDVSNREYWNILEPSFEDYGSTFTDSAPDVTRFAQELLVPGSTK